MATWDLTTIERMYEARSMQFTLADTAINKEFYQCRDATEEWMAFFRLREVVSYFFDELGIENADVTLEECIINTVNEVLNSAPFCKARTAAIDPVKVGLGFVVYPSNQLGLNPHSTTGGYVTIN